MRRAFMSLILLGFGLLLAYWGGDQLRLAYQTHSWPAIPGTILKTNVIQQVRTENDQNITDYYPDITYQYTVGDTTYEASRIQDGEMRMIGSDGADTLAERYPVGADVVVYYNPVNPQQAVLERTSYTQGAIYLAAGLFLATGALVSVVLGIRSRIRTPASLGQFDGFPNPDFPRRHVKENRTQ